MLKEKSEIDCSCDQTCDSRAWHAITVWLIFFIAIAYTEITSGCSKNEARIFQVGLEQIGSGLLPCAVLGFFKRRVSSGLVLFGQYVFRLRACVLGLRYKRTWSRSTLSQRTIESQWEPMAVLLRFHRFGRAEWKRITEFLPKCTPTKLFVCLFRLRRVSPWHLSLPISSKDRFRLEFRLKSG